MSAKRHWIGIVAALALAACDPAPQESAPSPNAAPDLRLAEYSGSTTCAGCHAREYAAWQGSQHALAMQHAASSTVLGDFTDERFVHRGVTSEFFRREDGYFVRTDGADGKEATFEVRYTFGVEPLQQYLVELPGGHVQALSIAWDSRPKDQGGQRWFHLYPDEKIAHDDELHWTKRQQNWNYMCADCHSTRLRKQYDSAADTYATTWSEISVGCEACHGPGSMHVDAAQQAKADGRDLAHLALTAKLDERDGIHWTIDPATGNARRSAPRTTQRELDVCGQCHARRGQYSDDYRPGDALTDHYRPALLTSPLYHSDGQQRDEVYNWGSFLSSRMNAAGVTCSDCHDPHTQKTRVSGNAVCGQCHAATKYDTRQHHAQEPGTADAQCASCHMKTETYMVVDPRHDHSFRLPVPGTGFRGYQTFAAAFESADRGDPRSATALAALATDATTSPIARASALSRLGNFPGHEAIAAATAGLRDPDVLVRAAAVDVHAMLPPLQRVAALSPLLGDPSRLVRMGAARQLAPLAADAIEPAVQPLLQKAYAEFEAAERFNADRPEHRVNLGAYFADRTDYAAAEAEYRAALALDRRFTPAWVNLADLQRRRGQEADAERTLRDGLAAAPGDAALHHALGLSLVRQRRMPEALRELARAAGADAAATRYAYVYAVALDSTGRTREAVSVLERASELAPFDRDVLSALVGYSQQLGDTAREQRYGARLLELDPAGGADANAMR